MHIAKVDILEIPQNAYFGIFVFFKNTLFQSKSIELIYFVLSFEILQSA